MSAPKPIDPRQHVWWHRLRRLGPFWFVGLGGAVFSPALTLAMYALVVIFYRRGWSTYVDGGVLIYLVTTPLFVGSCVWTWVYMEKRYGATLDVHCPRCGYEVHAVESERCPECGEPMARPA
ncbi:MAG: hypothetical protein ACYTF9_03905 [Planctomycetota bacterium]|jgi:hypothetical protein